MVKPPSLQDLQAFLEVATCQNVSRAAERLGITQPSLSVACRFYQRCCSSTRVCTSP